MAASTSPQTALDSTLPPRQHQAPGPLAPAPNGGLPTDYRKRLPCRFFGTDAGCRAGSACPYLHDSTRGQAAGLAAQSRVVSRPVPKAQVEDPREFQLGQIRRRFNPKETLGIAGSENGSTILNFTMKPSDPDFPFEMDALQCSLVVPRGYPGMEPESRPRMRVKNSNIPRGFAINIENGFAGLVEESKDATLLTLMTALDRNLERFLSEKKAETVKLVANADRRHLDALPSRSVAPVSTSSAPNTKDVIAGDENASAPERAFSASKIAEAKQRRDMETRQLETRLGRLPLYKKSADGIAYTLPVEPRRRSELPVSMQAINSVILLVPLLYPLECCRVSFEGLKAIEARNTEMAFEERAKKANEMSLMGHVNYLAQNMHILAKFKPPTSSSDHLEEVKMVPTEPIETPIGYADADRSHIRIIPRPPEWDVIDHDDLTDSDDDYSYDTGDEDNSDGGVGVQADQVEAGSSQEPLHTAERGTALSFPLIELYGIELLEVTILNLTVKCERCKESMDITGLKNGVQKTDSCKKCGTALLVTFRRDLVHSNAVRAGFLDLEGCTVVDMLPSTFIPTCSNCSTPYPLPGIVTVQGATATNNCRECHQKLTFKIPSIKLLRITTSRLPPATGPRRKIPSLGLTAGTELPRRGRCRHYSKSYRWFRFSCCQKVYACDKCHDEAEEHPNEHANRMICGFCSREQNYRPEDCGVCHAGLVGKRGTGFWEGGKGTRDKVRMNRKDKRKYRRLGAARAKE